MTAREVLSIIDSAGVFVTLDPPDGLRLRFPDCLPEEDRQRIIDLARENKAVILEALSDEPVDTPAAWAARMCSRCVSLATCGDSATCCWPLDASRVKPKDKRQAPYLRPLEVGDPCPAEGRGWDRWPQ